MQCPVCDHENSEGKRFCSQCGAKLVADERPTAPIPEAAAPDPKANEKRMLLAYQHPAKVHSASQSHCGHRKRNNEDRIRRVYLPYPDREIEVHALILADGIGGKPRGEFFAEAAVNDISTGIHWLMPDFDRQKERSTTELWFDINDQLTNHSKAPVNKANLTLFNASDAWELPKHQCGAAFAMIVVAVHTGSGLIKAYAHNGGDAECGVIVNGQLTILSREHIVFGGPSQFLGKSPSFVGTSATWQICMPEAGVNEVQFYTISDGVGNHVSRQQLGEWCSTLKSSRKICATAINQALNGPTVNGSLKPGHDNATIGIVSILSRGA